MIAKRIGLGFAVVAVIALAVLGWIVLGPGPMSFAGGERVALAAYAGPDPTGAASTLTAASLIERGEYLARAADCEACHTAPSGEPFAGGRAFNLSFGTLYSTNITPDTQTGIGDYSDEQFLAVMHEGIRRDGARLYPAMPFAAYTYMTRDDALAIKAYLFSLAPVHAPTRPDTLTFPFNRRGLMAIWSWAFNPGERFTPNASRSPEWNRGAYLAEALGHCGDCHTPRNLLFALDNRNKFAGTIAAGWHAYNISSEHEAGIGAWSGSALLSYLSAGYAAGHGGAAGPMGEVSDHSLSFMTAADINSLVAYLRSVPAVASDLPVTVKAPAPDSYKEGMTAGVDGRGEKIFASACVSCHGWSGISPLAPAATLTGERAVNDPSAVNVAQAVIAGVRRKTQAGSVFMPAFGDSYSDAEIAAVANYVTARFGAQGARMTQNEVASLRQQTMQ